MGIFRGLKEKEDHMNKIILVICGLLSLIAGTGWRAEVLRWKGEEWDMLMFPIKRDSLLNT